MKDDEDFSPQPTAQHKYVMDDEVSRPPISIIERARKAAARLAHAKEYAFFCYSCREHGLRDVRFREDGGEGPKQFRVSCGECCWSPRKKYASLEQVEKFRRARERIQSSASPPPVWPPEPPKPVVQSEAVREAFEKLFGKN